MRLLITADIHAASHQFHGGRAIAGINSRAESILAAIKSAADMAHSLEAQLVVAGDLFDKCTPDVRLVSETRRALGLPINPDTRDNDDKSVTRPAIISGNHDAVSSAPNDHALGCLYPAIVAEPGQVLWSQDHTVIYAGYQPGIKGFEHLENIVKTVKAAGLKTVKHRCLIIHLGIEDDHTAPWLKDSQDSIKLEDLRAFAKEIGVTTVAAGNWHARRVWTKAGEAEVLQVGALVPTGFDNTGLDQYGTAALWDSESGRLNIYTIPGDRFVKVNSLEDLESTLSSQANVLADPLHIRWIVDSKKGLEDANRFIEREYPPSNNLFIDVVLENKQEIDEVRATTIKAPMVQEVFAHHAPNVAVEACRLLQQVISAVPQSAVKVHKIKIKGAGLHTKSEVTFPNDGLVLFTGGNGAGKSTIAQAVSLTLWDELSVERPPIWTDNNPKISVEIDGIEFERTPNTKPNLKWTNGPKYDRKGDALKVIESQFGSLDNWCRTSFIEGSKRGYLTAAGPSDRRRIISDLCNISCFDDAYAKASLVVKDLESELTELDKKSAVLETKIVVLDTPEPELDRNVSVASIELQIKELQEAIEDASTDYNDRAKCSKALRDSAVRAKTLYLKAKDDQEKQTESGICPTCGQSISSGDSVHAHPIVDLEKQKEELKLLIEQVKDAEGVETELSKEISTLETKQSELQQSLWSIKNLLEKHETWQVSRTKRAELLQQINDLSVNQEVKKCTLLKEREIQYLFSPNGPRGELLERYCEALSNQATELLQIADGPDSNVRVTVAKKGIEITSSLGPSPSRGQERKLDIVLALSAIKLAELLEWPKGSTLFVDEGFEVMDETSIESLAKVFDEFAKTRCVVIMAHKAAEHFRGQARAIYEVENSEIKKLK